MSDHDSPCNESTLGSNEDPPSTQTSVDGDVETVAVVDVPIPATAGTFDKDSEPLIMIWVRTTTWLLVSAVWLLVGLYIWVPAVFAAGVFYAFGIMAAVFISRPGLLRRTITFLNKMSTLYPDGFIKIREAVFRPEGIEPDPSEADSSIGEALLLLLASGIGTLAAASVFWFAVALGVSFITGQTYWLYWIF